MPYEYDPVTGEYFDPVTGIRQGGPGIIGGVIYPGMPGYIPPVTGTSPPPGFNGYAPEPGVPIPGSGFPGGPPLIVPISSLPPPGALGPTSSDSALLAGIAAFFGGLAKIPSWVTALIAVGASLWSIWQRVSGGGGGAPPGTALVPRSPGTALVPRSPGNGSIIGPILGGPGVPEPKAGTYYRTWRTTYERRDGRNGYVWFWAMNDGYIVSYDSLSGRAKRWKPKKPVAVIMQGGRMSMQQFLRADRYLDRFARRLAKRSKKLKLA